MRIKHYSNKYMLLALGGVLVCLLFSFSLQAQQEQKIFVSGIVLGPDGQPIAGAAVTALSNRHIATFTDEKGSFRLNLPTSIKKIKVIALGHQIQLVNISQHKEVLTIVLVQGKSDSLAEVLVTTAGGIQKKAREQGYAATTITASTLDAAKPASIAAGLTAKVAGLQINGITSGVNPNYRIILRGNRSLTGNNEALIVVDGAVVPSELLNNINPEDVEDVNILNGAAGATLYGSDASNGVLVVTTKKGKRGVPRVTVSNTITFQKINFFPKLQDRFGSGSTSGAQVYDSIENQQYGPAFDGTKRAIGMPLSDGTQQYTTYSAKKDRYKFWNTGIINQTDFSVSSGDDRSTSYLSGQYLSASGTTPGDKYNRISVRYNGNRRIWRNFDFQYNASYTENNYDITSATSSIYSELIETPAQIPLLSYKNWHTGWGNLDNYYNGYYLNPYWIADNYREKAKNQYLTGKIQLDYSPLNWLDLSYRAALVNRSYYDKYSYNGYTYTAYAKSVRGHKTDFTGSESDDSYNKSQFTTDFLATIKKSVGDINFNLIGGASLKAISIKSIGVSASSLQIPELYNVSNRIGAAGASESISQSRLYGLWYDFTVGYKNYLYVELTGRNDWVSVLSPKNRSFFYPSANLSFVATDAINFLKNNQVLSYVKLRAGWSHSGLVNLDPYSLDPTFSSVTGYSKGTYYSLSSTLVSKTLKPEMTRGYEFGTDFRLWRDVIDGSFTYYYTSTRDQVVNGSVSYTTGFSSYLLNTGQVTNQGIESVLHLTAINTRDWTFKIGGNYTHNKNFIKSINPNLPSFGVNGSSVIYAVQGHEVNSILVTDYARDNKGRIIVDAYTGYPSIATTSKNLGNTTPHDRLSLDFSLRWKGFTLTSLFEFRGGYKVAAISLGNNLDFSGSSARSAYYNRERFVIPNSSYYDQSSSTYVANTNITVSDGGAGFWTSSAYNTGAYSNYVVSGNYWKWRELTLSYQFPDSWIRKSRVIRSARISIQGRNLFLWTPKSNEYTDPDYSANDNNAMGVSTLDQTPPTRYFGATLSLDL